MRSKRNQVDKLTRVLQRWFSIVKKGIEPKMLWLTDWYPSILWLPSSKKDTVLKTAVKFGTVRHASI